MTDDKSVWKQMASMAIGQRNAAIRRAEDADKAHAKTLVEFHEMKARAEAAERLIENSGSALEAAALIARAEAAEYEAKRYCQDVARWHERAKAAEKQIAEFKLERDYVWGFNAGFDEAKEQFTARAEAAEKRVAALERSLAVADRRVQQLLKGKP